MVTPEVRHPLRSDLAVAPTECRPRERRDLVAAGLAKVERVPETASKWRRTRERYDAVGEYGRALDFHCLRVTFVSRLVAAGVHPRTAQALGRHAKLETTMASYTDLS